MAYTLPRKLAHFQFYELARGIWEELHHKRRGLIIRDIIIAHVDRRDGNVEVVKAIGVNFILQEIHVIRFTDTP